MSNENFDSMEHERGSTKSPPVRQHNADPGDKQKEPVIGKLRRFIVRRPKILLVGWGIVTLLFLTPVPAAYLCWWIGIPQLWEWANAAWWHWLPAVFGFCFLFIIPIWVVIGASRLASFLADISLSIEDAVVLEKQKNVRETEDEAIRRLEQTDSAGLLPLLKYSRAQLDAYYEVSLKQTRKSFLHAVLAMWLGFILLLVGIALYVCPVEKLGLKPPTQDFDILILSGAAIIEFISALFLWVYRSTTTQLTYFYNRQMNSHNSILCFRMASTMDTDKADDTKQAIIEKFLDLTTMPERPPLFGAKGLRTLLSASKPKTAPK